jgi:hypothetical protein
MKTFLNVATCLLLLSLSACVAQTGSGDEPQLEPSAAAAESRELFQTGVASWYGDDFHGQATANGEIYDMYRLTAAHQNLPFHTLVEVENLENQKKVLVRINDRGPFLKDRIIDLSLKAAQRLDMAVHGTTKVNLRVLRWGGAEMEGTGSRGTVRACVVQAGAFSVRKNAEDMLLTLAEIFPELNFRIAVEDDLFKILSPQFAGQLTCREILKKLAAFQLQGFIREWDMPAGK